ncbi:MAG: PEP-CTERM sorting domain-containing protein [Nitrosospira sp.]
MTSQGFSPVTGGTGSFVASVVPEPSASLLFLGGLSMLWLVFARRWFSGSGGGNGMQVSLA